MSLAPAKVVCRRCDVRLSRDLALAQFGMCGECYPIWLACKTHIERLGGADFSITRFPRLAAEIAGRANAPSALIARGFNAYVIQMPWWIS